MKLTHEYITKFYPGKYTSINLNMKESQEIFSQVSLTMNLLNL